MLIRGKEYGFAFTVGAKIALGDITVSGNNAPAKTYVNMALVMSKAYEDICKLDDPDYVIHPLDRVTIECMTEKQFEQLCREIDSVVMSDQKMTVKTEPIKSKKK